MKPFIQLFLLGLTCYLIMALSQAAGVLVYRLSQGQSIDGSFIRYAFVLTRELPPYSDSWLQSIPSIFEEITFRGLVLAMFLRFYSKSKAILFSSIIFGLMHILTILDGRPPVWTAGQVLWAAILGLFYSYVTIKSNSLLPAIMVHYLSNLFVAAINAYLQNNASIPIQAIYGVIFTFGIVPSFLMILWTRFFANRWLINQKTEIDQTG
jgi:membrane protease YdiL (CAAX protease family)